MLFIKSIMLTAMNECHIDQSSSTFSGRILFHKSDCKIKFLAFTRSISFAKFKRSTNFNLNIR